MEGYSTPKDVDLDYERMAAAASIFDYMRQKRAVHCIPISGARNLVEGKSTVNGIAQMMWKKRKLNAPSTDDGERARAAQMVGDAAPLAHDGGGSNAKPGRTPKSSALSLSEDLSDQLAKIRSLGNGSKKVTAAVAALVKVISAYMGIDARQALILSCDKLGLSDWTDSDISSLLQATDTTLLSDENLRILLQTALLGRLKGLQKPASRPLMQAIRFLAKEHPDAMLYAIALPLVARSASEWTAGALEVLPCHAELATAIIKVCPAKTLSPECTSVFFGGRSVYTDGSDALQIVVNDATLSLLKTIASDRKVVLHDHDVQQMVRILKDAIDAAPQKFAKSPKFSSVIHALISKREVEIKPHISLLERLVEKTTSFLKRGMLSSLRKLAATSA